MAESIKVDYEISFRINCPQCGECAFDQDVAPQSGLQLTCESCGQVMVVL